MLARYAAVGAFESAAASAKSLAPRFAEGGLDITPNWMRWKRCCRNRWDGGLAFCGGRVQIFFLGGVLRVQCLTFGGDGLLRLLESGFRGFQAALGIFSAHHDFELAVFSFGDFGFGVGDFVLKRFVGFVGFNRPALFAVFLGALFPLLDVELEFLALGKSMRMGFAGGGNGIARPGQLQVGLAYALGESLQFRAQRGN